MNNVNLIGRLTATPELKQTKNGIDYTIATIAVPRNNKNKETDFVRIKAYRQTAKYLTDFTEKGSKIAISGVLRVDNATDGTNNSWWEVVAEHIDIVDYKKSNENLTPPSPYEDIFA